MKMIVSSVLALALSASFQVSYAQAPAQPVTVATQSVDARLISQSPYSQAQIMVVKEVNGVEKVVGSKIVSVTNASSTQYSDTAEYIGECVKTEGETTSECTSKSTPIGMLAQINYRGGTKDAPVYKINVAWRELVTLNSFDQNDMTIYVPQVRENSFLQTVKYTKPFELKGSVVNKGHSESMIVRVTLM